MFDIERNLRSGFLYTKEFTLNLKEITSYTIEDLVDESPIIDSKVRECHDME